MLPRHVFTLGLDVDLNNVITAIQRDRGAIALPQKFSRARLCRWIREKVAAGHTMHTVYEACGFDYTLHEQLRAAGAHSLITTPLQLSPERRRKNDRMDARQLCVRLSRHLDGHAHELKPIRSVSGFQLLMRPVAKVD
jgi:transposase